MFSLVVLFAFFAVRNHYLPLTTLLLPLVLLPFLLFVLGVAWFLSALGVYLRDVSVTVAVLTTALMFVSPLFYPIEMLPEWMQPWMFANPLTLIMEQTRAVLIWGNLPDWGALGLYGIFGLAVATSGLWWFQKTRKGFADVL
jgi:lipopolysaccharide transport system permease protein